MSLGILEGMEMSGIRRICCLQRFHQLVLGILKLFILELLKIPEHIFILLHEEAYIAPTKTWPPLNVFNLFGHDHQLLKLGNPFSAQRRQRLALENQLQRLIL